VRNGGATGSAAAGVIGPVEEGNPGNAGLAGAGCETAGGALGGAAAGGLGSDGAAVAERSYADHGLLDVGA